MTASPVFGKVYMASQLPMHSRVSLLPASVDYRCATSVAPTCRTVISPAPSITMAFSVDEVRRVTRAFSALGTEKFASPVGTSLRRDFTEIAAVRENPAIRQIAVTTNGYRRRAMSNAGAMPA